MAQVQGHCDDRFSSLRTLLQSNIDSGEELGASLAVELDGKVVVDLWGGYTDESRNEQWQENTIVNVWSTTKNVGSLAALLAVDRGFLDLDEKVSKYWPEFAANGKEEIRVRQIISHTSGVAGWDGPISMEEYYDVKNANVKLAEQAPWWEPGTASGYHAFSHGHLISELLRRTTGKSLKKFVADELAGPLNTDFQLGLAEKDDARVTNIVIPPPPPSGAAPPPPEPGSVKEKASKWPPFNPSLGNTKAWRDAEIGSGNGHANGRSVARILSPLALGGKVDGKQYLSPNTIEQIFREQANGLDLSVGLKIRFGTGFGLPAKDTYFDWAPCEGRVFGWGGFGGSMGIVDVDRRMTIGYAMNKMHPVGMGSVCTKAYVAEIYRILGVEI